jgi:hypothetical protein
MHHASPLSRSPGWYADDISFGEVFGQNAHRIGIIDITVDGHEYHMIGKIEICVRTK